ncbi:uncharacterized protein LOC119739402 [Patiria miniata]|uniref:Uncharacterized protein n=1 Tax=Patiria miniata TaxID=46514 RepID=A0A914B2Z3_PATMI|nr:uncharacterized protein LOC119739402 [Patiria miniata]XP_038070387.1 uncharacterized protein LOC119739402 [Patiria miniata]
MRIVAALLVILRTLDRIPGFSQQNIEGGMPVKGSDMNVSIGREKRSDAAESPLYVSERKAYLQTDHAYHLPCAVIRPDESVSIVFWFKGESLDAALRTLILRQSYPNDGLNFAEDDRYQISTSYGIIIDPVNSNDTDWYWCKTVRKSTNQIVEDYLDVTVLDTTFPRESESTASNVTTLQSHEGDNIVKCPVLAEAPAMTDITLYWSVYNDTTKNHDIIFAMFSGGERLTFHNYEEVGSNGLAVDEFERREERYCCHVFEKSMDLRTGCVRVTWLAEAKQQYPSISGCESTDQKRCDLTLTLERDCARYDCSIRDVYPQPALNWSLVNCEEDGTPTFVQTESSTYFSSGQSYDVTSRLYIVEAVFKGECEFSCSAYGDAINGQTSKSDVYITRDDSVATTSASPVTPSNQADCDCKWTMVIFLTFIMAFLIHLLIFWFILIFPRNRRFIKTHIDDLATFPCQRKGEEVTDLEMANTKQDTCADSDENVLSAKLDSMSSTEDNTEAQTEISPMLTKETEERGVSDGAEEGPLCLVIRGDSDILITDSKNKWRPMGEFVTQSALDDNNGSGFQAIKDVVCAQDGGLFVIDAQGLHRFNSDYTHRFIDLYQSFSDEGYCSVTYHTANRLLFGLSRGKLVDYDIHNRQTTNFGSVTRVRHTDVQLSDMSVDSLGFVFAGDRNGKAVSMFDNGGGCLTRMEIGMEPAFLHAHARHESQSLFVSSGVAVKKYNIVKSSTNSKILPQIRFTIDADLLGVENFHSGYVTVQENKLFVVNHLEVGECLQILELDAGKGTQEHSIIVETLGLRGVKFIDRDRMVVYTDDSVYLFERSINSE